MRKTLTTAAGVALVLISGAGVSPGHPKEATEGANGRITLFRYHISEQQPSLVYTVNPDGSVLQHLTKQTAAHPHWSPDGIEIAVDAEIDSPTQPSAFIFNVDTGALRELTGTSGRGCQVWSPDGSRLACNGDGLNGDTAIDPGITTIRSTDGGDLRRVTDFVGIPGDYSPDGNSLSLVGMDDEGDSACSRSTSTELA